MRFDLVRPCKDCPFRRDCLEGWLGAARAQQIIDEIAIEGRTFTCHETTQHDDETGEFLPNEDNQHCAGALILQLKNGNGPNQMARIAYRLGILDLDALKLEPVVFETLDEFVEHHT